MKKIENRGKKPKSRKPIEISQEAKFIITGLLLGDGSIGKHLRELGGQLNCNSKLIVKHCEKQRGYCKWICSILNDAGIKTTYKEYERCDERFKNPNHITCITTTLQNISLNYYRDLWYKDKKIIPDIYNDFNELSLAIWFMDDGTREKSSYSFATMGFDIEYIEYLKRLLKQKFNIETTIWKNKILYVVFKDREKFINLIKPYIHESMQYKIVRVKQEELLENPTLERQKEDNQQPSINSNIFEGSETNSQIQTSNVEDSNGNTSMLLLKTVDDIVRTI